jgi:CheY-like chemotaxis protein
MEVANIVLIEDNPGDVMLVELALKEAGIKHELTRFETGLEAVENLCGSKEIAVRPDAILLDLNTPRSDGFEVLGNLTTSPGLSDIPIALLTSSKARFDKSRAELLRVRYVEKPSQLHEFLSVVGHAVSEMLASRGPSVGQAS